MIIAVDFDGTLHSGKWPEIGMAQPYAIEVMNKLKADGHYIIIWTCRDGRSQQDAINWLLEKSIPFDRINDHHPDTARMYGYSARKVYAHLYIDDKQVGGLPTWPEIYDTVKEMEERYKSAKNGK